MKNLLLFTVLVTLPLLLGGCGENVVNDDEIEYREGVAYLKGSNRSYTGKIIGLNSRGKKRSESQLEKGKMISWIGWHDNGKKAGEENYQNGHSYRKYWDEKGEIVSLLGEALGSVYYVKPSEPVSVSPKLKYEIKGDAVTITGFDRKPSGELTIPATIEGNPVTNIGVGAFHQYTSLTSITIPDGVTSIGDFAFSECTNLTNINIPDGVTSIGFGAFFNCTNLTSIVIPDGVTSIEGFAFDQCTSLTAVTFLGDTPKEGGGIFSESTPTIYRKPEAKGWGDTWGGRTVQLISEKP